MVRTPLEQIWYDFFVEHNIAFEEQVHFGRYVADFVVNGNIDIEVDGLQHSDPKRIKLDKARDRYLLSLGIKVIRIKMNFHNRNKKRHMERLEKQKAEILSILMEC